MIIGNTTASIYPFSRNSTLNLTTTGVKMPAERIKGAKLYPKVAKNTLLHIRQLTKTKHYIKLAVVGDADEAICDIYFALSDQCPVRIPPYPGYGDCVGYAVQDDVLCGCLLGDELLIPLLRAIPDMTFSLESFILSTTVCFNRVEEKLKTGRLLHDGREVETLEFAIDSGTLVISANGGFTINTDSVVSSVPLAPVKTICINNSYYLGGQGIEDVYIKSDKDSGVRVISDIGGITIGRLADL